MKRIVIIGGGLAGLISAIKLARAGVECQVIEKKSYPFHRVCGEYISNEVVPFLQASGLYPDQFEPPQIRRFMLSSTSGRAETIPLDLGGFGISRYTYDTFLFEEAKKSGVQFFLNTEAQKVKFFDNRFEIETTEQKLIADVVIGAFGKRSKLDVTLNRDFVQKRSPYVGVKYHVRTEHPIDLIALHNFPGGYCGISHVEGGKSNLCYLTHRRNLKEHKNIHDMERNILYQNPLLRSLFTQAEFLMNQPETINEISFETKSPVQNHILMAGDSAGMITPLCGNGMAMAIHAAKILSELVIQYCQDISFTREQLEKRYSDLWNQNFSTRLWVGRQIQKLFGNTITSSIAVNLAVYIKPVANIMMKASHGKPFT
ncbi:MAG TPA: NAD(P)/FAD-dependent oxidoreductase [Ohtaekwangia sp.]